MDPTELANWNKKALNMTSHGLLLLEYITKSEPKWRQIFVRKKHFYKEAIICTICETSGISGIKSLQQHITGKRHQLKLKSTVIGIRQAEVNLTTESGKEKETKQDDSQLQKNCKEKENKLPESNVSSENKKVETFRNQLITLKLEDLLKVEYKYINTDWNRLIEKKGNFLHCLMCKNIKLDNINAIRNHFRNRQHSTNILLVKMLHHPDIFPNKEFIDKSTRKEIVDLTDDKKNTESKIVESDQNKNKSSTNKDNSVKNAEVPKGDTTKISTDQSTNENKNKNSESTSDKILTNNKCESGEISNRNKEKQTSLQSNVQNIREELSTNNKSNNKLPLCDSVAVKNQDKSSKILNDEEFREIIPKLSMIEINEVDYLGKKLWLKLVSCGENQYSCFLCGLLNAKGNLSALRIHFAGRLHKEKLSIVQKFFHPKYTKSKKDLEKESNMDGGEEKTQQKETDVINLDEYLSPEENLNSPNKDFVLNPAKLALKTRQLQNATQNTERIISPRPRSFNKNDERSNISQKTVSPSNSEKRSLGNVENEKKEEKIIIPRVNFAKKSTTNFYEKDYQRIDETNEGLIGVEYVVKILKNVNDTSPRFECCLCEGEMSASGMQMHLKSVPHRRKYLERHFPTCMRQYQQYSKHKNFDYLLTNITKKLAIAIEKYHGRDLPFECLEDEYRLNRDGIVSKVFSFRHSSEICGPSFTNIVDKKTIDDLINETNFKRRLPSQNDYSSNHVQRKRARERSPVLDVEEHKKLVEAFLENTRRGYRQRSTSPLNTKLKHSERGRRSTFGSYRNDVCKSSSRSRSRSRSPSTVIIDTKENWQNYRRMLTHAMEDLDKDYEEYKKNPESHPDYNSEWKAYWLERSKELCDEGREPSTYNFQPGWIRFFSKRIYELYDDAVKKLKKTLKKKLSLPLDVGSPRIEDNIMTPKTNIFDNAFKTVSYPSTSGQFSSCIPQQNTMSMQFTHNNNDEMSLTKPISYPNVNNSIQNDDTMIMMQSKLNSRPSFGEQHSSTTLEPYWENTNQDEFARKEGRSRIVKHQDRLEKGQDQDKEINRPRREKSPIVDRYSLKDKSENRFNSTSSRRYSSDFDESPKNNTFSISVLRLLTALEDHLGILGPRVVNLLSEALTLEKVKPCSVDEELLNRENYIFLETVREKLRGQILADVVDGPKERAIKKCLKDLQILLKKVGDKHLKTLKAMQTETASPVISSTPRKDTSQISSTSNTSNIIVNKEEIATKLAAALAAQGKTDITPDELKQLIAIYTLIEQKQQEANIASQPSTSRSDNTIQKSKYGNTSSTQKKSLSDTLLDILKTSSEDNNKKNTNENQQDRREFSGRNDQSNQIQRKTAEQVNRGQQLFRQNAQECFRTNISSNSPINTSNITTRQQSQMSSSNVVPNVVTNSSTRANSYYQHNTVPNSYNFTQSNQQQQLISGNQSYGQCDLQQQKTTGSNISMNSQFGGLSQFDTSLRVDRGENIATSLNANFSRRSGDLVNNFARYSTNQSGQDGVTFRNSNLNPGSSNNFNNNTKTYTNANNSNNSNNNSNNNNNPRQALPVKVWQNQIHPWTRNW